MSYRRVSLLLVVLCLIAGPALPQEPLAQTIDRGRLLGRIVGGPAEGTDIPPEISAARARLIENRAIAERAGLEPIVPDGRPWVLLPPHPDTPGEEGAGTPLPPPFPPVLLPTEDLERRCQPGDMPTILMTRPRALRPLPAPISGITPVPPPDLPKTNRPAENPRPAGVAPALVQLDRRLGPEEAAALAQEGIAIEGFLGGSTYIVTANPAEIGQSSLAARITAGRLMRGEDKILDDARAQITLREGSADPAGADLYFVQLLADLAPATILPEMVALGASDVSLAPDGLVVMASPQAISAISGHPAVLAVTIGPAAFHPLNDQARAMVGVDEVQDLRVDDRGREVFDGLSGAGVRVAVYDTGVDERHRDFCNLTPAAALGKYVFHDVPEALCSCGMAEGLLANTDLTHGTHVASILAGSGVNSRSAQQSALAYAWRGTAPGAMLISHPSSRGSPADLSGFALSLASDGAEVSNHSYVESLGGYGAMAQMIDSAIAGEVSWVLPSGDQVFLPPHPQIWAAGNNGRDKSSAGFRVGYGSVFTQAKNSISVGSVDTTGKTLSDYSSLGPTQDGRIKPDLVAPGCHDSPTADTSGGIRAASAGRQGYALECGTSMAAPVVAGIIALMREAAGRDIEPASYKAALVVTAQDQIRTTASAASPINPDTGRPVFYEAGPDFATGFGLIDAGAAVALMREPARLVEAEVSDTVPRDCHVLDLPEGSETLRVALVWDDPPATLSKDSISRLVHDLDIRLIGPDQKTYLPWVLAPPPSAAIEGLAGSGPALGTVPWPDPVAQRGIDRLNNVELVEVDAPPPGRWQIEVMAAQLSSRGKQRFSLAASTKIGGSCTD